MCRASWSCAGWWGPMSAWTKVGHPEGISQGLRSAAACSGVMSEAERQEAGRTQTLPGSQAGFAQCQEHRPAMEEEEEQPSREADVEPVLTSGASEVVPRVLSGEPQSLSDMDAFNLLLEMKLTRRQERPDLPRTVTQLVAEDGSRVYVVGTAHFSDDSKRDVVKTIREVQPDVVVVELCQYRVSMLKMDEAALLREAKELSLEKLQQAVRQNGVMSGLMQMLLLKVSAHITEQLGMAPGGEFREAFKEASKVPFCKFHLGDRPIPVTFKRAIAALSFWQKVKLAWGLCFLSDPISKDDVERCKQKDLLEQMMAEMIGEFPDLHRTIVSERDIYLTYVLSRAQEVRPVRGGGRRGHGPRPRH
ncbi:traB domain-containing protein isoform X6 [Manis pentadactyla]|uniref:traB domain-containing protein isoform X6 n=1 Tax=Manis pentadactyla TaxID=143292 RepID=UPI00255D0036|nr:traB domain-containing protein isoform X6 [Manis pentadactyla]XP_036762643.2 traB domain-containing protein isoform X6 [Manis pentadactyla]XP_036762644.2 traB domain-containing protein isoform X6 [Manis pentadactyla]XP_036762645.2 traB domain-containing protein isoform X6 [Manis pentadactyla]